MPSHRNVYECSPDPSTSWDYLHWANNTHKCRDSGPIEHTHRSPSLALVFSPCPHFTTAPPALMPRPALHSGSLITHTPDLGRLTTPPPYPLLETSFLVHLRAPRQAPQAPKTACSAPHLSPQDMASLKKGASVLRHW